MLTTQKLTLAFLSLGLLALSFAETAQAQSLWQQRKQSRVHVFRDVKARNTGDLLTVVVKVATDVNNQNRRSMQKTTDAEANGQAGFSGAAGAGTLQADYTTDSSRNFQGNSSLNVANNFSDRFSVTVLDVQANGNLVIGGKRRVNVEGDVRTIVLTGIIRAIDIQHDNSIDSKYVANLRVQYESKGNTKEFTRQGWLMKRLNKVWPF